MTPLQVMKKWESLTPKQRNSRMARQYAKLCGMRSMGEVRCAADMKRRRIPYKYEATTLTYQHEPQKYTPDFLLYKSDDLLIEYKGKMTNETRKKLLSIQRCNPDQRICLVFEKPNNKIRKGSKTTYWQWAEKNNFPWSEHYVKSGWLKNDFS
jgi:hypothetical protein